MNRRPRSGRRTVAIVTPFSPTKIPGCVSWLRSDKLVTLSSGKVSAWGDSSSLGINGVTQVTAALQPVYATTGGANNRPYFNCGQSAYSEMRFPISAFISSAPNACDTFIVFNNDTDPPTGGGTGTIWVGSATDNEGDIPYIDGHFYDRWGRNGASIDAGIPTGNKTSTVCVYNVASTTGNWTSFLNGTIITTTSTNTYGISPNARLFSLNSAFYLKGKAYEFIMFNRVLSSLERSQINHYIYNRYGISGV